jgi:putative ABC transport system permease protein
MRSVRHLIHRALDPARIAHEVEGEIRFHIESRTRELVAAGMDARDAREAAARSFGDAAAVAAECRAVRLDHVRRQTRTESMRNILQDVRFAARVLRRTPGFTIVAVLTLALGIGANTAIWGAVNAVLLRPLPFADPGRLVSLAVQPGASVSKATFVALRGQVPALADVASYSRWGFSLTGRGEPALLVGATSSANLFALLGRTALIGRALQAGDDRQGADPVVVLSYGLWQTRFGAAREIVGQTLTLNGKAHTVVGVMPPAFTFPVTSAALWTATILDPADAGDYTAGYLSLIGRLRPGGSIGAARDQLRDFARRRHAADPGRYPQSYGAAADVRSLRDDLTANVESALLMLLGAVAFVLLIACANVANLLLARAVVREREMAVRVALGAGRSRLVRQLVTESMLLSATGAVLGVALAYALIRVTGRALPADLAEAGGVSVDLRVLGITAGLAVIVGVLFGLAPAVAMLRRDPVEVLRAGGRSQSRGRMGGRTMRTLIVAEVALAMVLVTGAGLLLQSYMRLSAESPGFRTSGILTVTVAPPETQYADPARRRAFLAAVTERIGALPSVVSVGAVHLLPFGGSNWNPELVIEGRPPAADGSRPEVDWRVVTPEFFATMAIPLVRGRLFTSTDGPDGQAAALVNTTLARTLFPGEDPIGRRIRTFFERKDGWVTIVGVVGDTKDQSLALAPRPQMYRPFAQYPMVGMALMVRTTLAPSSIAQSVRSAIWSVDRDVPIERLDPLGNVVGDSIAQSRLAVSLLGAFGALALVLGAIGIYGVMSYAVAQRTRELGLRLALGAVASDVVRLVLRDAATLSLLGLGLGAAAALAVTRVLVTQLHGVRPTDPATFVGAALLLGATSVAASLRPAWRAGRVEPAQSMRSDG